MAEKARVSCLNCGATNNYPLEAQGKKVLCGRCKSRLPQPGILLEVDESSLEILIRNSKLPLLVDFYSPTCAPCQRMHPVLENLAERRAGELMAVKVNVDDHPEIAASFGVQGVPTFVIISKGNVRGRQVGDMNETDFSLWAASLI